MPGAIALAGMAALRGGSGLVTLAVPVGIQQTVAGYEPSYMTMGLPEESRGEVGPGALAELETRLDEFDCIGLGPGLGRREPAGQGGAKAERASEGEANRHCPKISPQANRFRSKRGGLSRPPASP